MMDPIAFLFKVKILIDVRILGVQPAAHFISNPKTNGPVIFIISE
jgi:hypothetical protein